MNVEIVQPMKLSPMYKDMIWGGSGLREYLHKPIPSEHTGESWEVSAHPSGQSRIAGGPCQGMTLGEAVSRLGADLVGTEVWKRYGNKFPLLIKFIDAHDKLSVQVHPNDEQARRLEGAGESGKTEMWYVLHAQPGAKLVYGFKREIAEDELEDSIASGTIESLLNWVDVKAGDTFFIPAGTLHAIGAGILIAEIQQSSDTTYRVYDYNRLGLDGKPRQLHVEKALQVVNRASSLGEERSDIDAGVCCPFFETKRVRFRGEEAMAVPRERFEILICLEGSGTANDVEFGIGDVILLPAAMGTCLTKGEGMLLKTHVAL